MKQKSTVPVVAADLRHRIEEGEWPADGYLPTYKEIGEEYNISRASVAKVVQTLRVWGCVVTSLSGIRVRPPKPIRVVVPGESLDSVSRFTGTETMPTFSWVRTELGQSDGDMVHRSRWVVSDADGVLCVEDSYTAVSRAPEDLIGATGSPLGPFKYVRTWVPSLDEQQLLEMGDPYPVLAFLSVPEPGQVVVRIFPGDRVQAAG